MASSTWCVVGGIALFAPAASANVTVYRCEGRPALYTTDTRLIRERACLPVSGPLKAASAEASRAPAGPGAGKSVGAAAVPRAGLQSKAAREPGGRAEAPTNAALVVPSSVQRVRDEERLRILHDELTSEEARLTELRARRAVAPRETDRAHGDLSMADLDRAVQRSEQSISALRREIELARR
jgi:hypothetical protein